MQNISVLFFLPVVYPFRIHIVVEETEPGEIFPFRTGNAVVAVGVDRKATAGEELAPYLDVPGTKETDEIGHDHIDAVFVEITVIPVAEEIELQGFAFHHPFVGNIGNINGSKVRLPRFGAETRKFRAVEFDEIIPVAVLVGNPLQKLRVIIIGVLRIPAAQLCELVQAFSFFRHRVPRINKILCNWYKNSIDGERSKWEGIPDMLRLQSDE